MPMEATIMQWWAELLDSPPQSPDDDFFDLGGNSLRLVQFMVRVRERFGVELPLDTLYVAGFTVTQVVRAIQERQLAEADQEELTELLEELEGLSDEEIEALLAGDGN